MFRFRNLFVLGCACWITTVWVDSVLSFESPSITVSTREELVRSVKSAGPGTRIEISPGTYRGGLDIDGLNGAVDRPIVLIALDVNNPPVLEGGASGIHMSRSSYVELHHLVLRQATGNGLNIDDGGDIANPTHHLVLSNLQVQDVGPKGNRDGIKLSGVDHFAIEDCTVQRWGDSGSAIDMVGCHQGRVSGCTFKYRDDIAGNGVQTKGGSSSITIQHCRFENAGGRAVNIGGSTGRAFFRPSLVGYEAKDIIVEDCTFVGSMAPIAFVGVDGATVRHNTIFRPTRWIIRILQESQGAEFVPCRNGSFTNNLVVFRSDEVQTVVNVGGGTDADTFSFAKNHWYCIDNSQRSSRLGLPTAEVNGSYGKDPQFIDSETLDLRLMPTTPVVDAGVRTPTKT